MTRKLNIFEKSILVIVLSLVPFMLLFYYSTEKSIHVMQDELINSSKHKMRPFMVQLDSNIMNFELAAADLMMDSNILDYRYNMVFGNFELYRTRVLIKEKLSLSSSSGNIQNYLTVYFPQKPDAISSLPNTHPNRKVMKGRLHKQWLYEDDPNMGPGFTKYLIKTYAPSLLWEDQHLVLGIGLYQKGFESMLDSYKSGNSGDPFFYKKGFPSIPNRTLDVSRKEWAVQELSKIVELGKSGHLIRSFSGTPYLITYHISESLGWYLVDTTPMDDIFEPIKEQRILFWVTLMVFVAAGLVAAFTLYRHVQIPILRLLRGVQRIKQGNYSYRVADHTNNEFKILIQNFNEMAEQIQYLIENELQARLQARDAMLNQLQAQIHPHFLYNCFGYIINMTKLGKSDAVVNMAHHLSDFYRYSTRMDSQMVPIKKEMDFITSFLMIHRLRDDNLSFTIELPAALESCFVPRFLIQPIVENVLVHGFANMDEGKKVIIRASEYMGKIAVSIEDSGTGMLEPEIKKVLRKLHTPAKDYKGCGLWNVYQRLVNHYGKDSEMRIEPSTLGGLSVTLVWQVEASKERDIYDKSVDRR